LQGRLLYLASSVDAESLWSFACAMAPATRRWILPSGVRRLRAQRGLSQEALAHECGINRTYLSGVDRSERNISIDNIARVARGLKVKAWTLLDDSVK
jgi:hypothetical protein